MSQPGQKPTASPRPRRAAAAHHTKERVSEKTSGSPSKPEEKKGAVEKNAASPGSSQPSRTHASGTTSTSKVSASSAATSKSSSMNPTETKAILINKQIEGPLSPIKKRHKKQAAKTEPEKKSQSTKPSVVHEKKTQVEKPKEHKEPKSLPKHASDTGSKQAHSKKVPKSSEQLTTEKSTEPKTKSQDTISAGGKSAVAGVAAASGKPDDKKKEKKPLATAAPVDSKLTKPPGKSDMEAALDDLIDTLGGPEETEEANTAYTGPEVSDPMSSTYIEELGKREVTIPLEYRELLAKNEGIAQPPADSVKPMGPDDAIDALSSDFTCSSPTAAGKDTEKEKSTEEVLKAQSAGVIRSAAAPREKRRKVEEDTMSDQALDALSASLGTREPEPELDLSSIKEVDEAKAKEEKLKKCGEDDETIPPEFRLKPATDKDGKPLLPKEPKEQLPPMSEDLLLEALSEDFSGPENTSSLKFEDAKLSAAVSEVVSQTPASTTHSAAPPPKASESDHKKLDDALDKLSDSLGQRQPDPDENKPMEDKVKEKAKAEHRDKLGERDDTIPPEYRHLLDADNWGKPGEPSTKKPKESKKPGDDRDPIDALSGDFDSSPSTTDTSPNTAKDKDKKTDSSTKAPKNEDESKESAKDKDKKTDSSTKAPRNEDESKESAKAKEEASKPKADKKDES
ncbi:calpastatin isoform X13 [Elephas maximus indicus]|uniref:calpastatin isoform X13 n=1 Tax=Elephas maximus indicus TaxID=99487 RepID=UPI002116D68F|nr:calpastatin isoform X13 [Elephas maximus indicus]